jgi:hypothetical protein
VLSRIHWGLLGLAMFAGGALAAEGDQPQRVAAAVVEDATQAAWDKEGAILPEGWVLMSRCVGKDGTIKDPIVMDSSGHKELERAAREGLRASKYTPATFGGTPITSCDLQFVVFQHPDTDHGARPEFVAAWTQAEGEIKAKHYDQALVTLDAIKGWNIEEGIRVAILRAEIARAEHQDALQLRWLENLLNGPAQLPPAMAQEVVQRVFSLELRAQQYAAALATYRQLQKMADLELTSAEKKAGAVLEALPDGDQAFATPGRLDGRFAGADQSPTWSTNLLRREFTFTDVEGNPERFELRCENNLYQAAFDTSNQWRVPNSWGECLLIVFGPADATFKLVEMPKAPPAK